MVGYRILTDDGRVTPLGKAAKGSSPRDEGATRCLRPGARARHRAGYYSLDRRGGVLAFGGHGVVRARCGRAAACTGRSTWPTTAAVTATGSWPTMAACSPTVRRSGIGSLSSRSGRVVPRKLRATPTGKGYWILTATGRIYRLRRRHEAAGSPADRGRSDVVDFAPTADGPRLLGPAQRRRGAGLRRRAQARATWPGKRRPPTAIMAAPSGKGYYLLTADGSVTAFGKVAWFGGVAVQGPPRPGHLPRGRLAARQAPCLG